MGYHLVGVGWLLIFGGVGAFILGQVGPYSKLWWPDRVGNWRRARVVPAAFIVVGTVLVIVGALTA